MRPYLQNYRCVLFYCTGFNGIGLQVCVHRSGYSGKLRLELRLALMSTRLINRNWQMDSNKPCDVCSVALCLRNTPAVREIIDGNKLQPWISYYWVGSGEKTALKDSRIRSIRHCLGLMHQQSIFLPSLLLSNNVKMGLHSFKFQTSYLYPNIL